MRLIVTINFLGSKSHGFMVWGTRVYSLEFDVINFVKEGKKETCNSLFFIMKAKANVTKVFLVKSQCILNANVIAIIEGLINCYYKEQER